VFLEFKFVICPFPQLCFSFCARTQDVYVLYNSPSSTDPAPVINGIPPGGETDLSATKPRLGKNSFSASMKTKRDVAHDHHLSRRGKYTGRAKKGGGGGRYVWGAALDMVDADADAAADRGDPNWNSEEEDASLAFAEERTTQIAAFKSAISGISQEYFNSGDLNEASISLQELDHPEFGHYFVKKVIVAALDRHEREREMTSVLLSTLYNETISPEEMRRGMADVVDALDDLQLDVPDAANLMALFICRAVADDVLPPAFIHKIDGSPGSAVAGLRSKCEAYVADQHFAERMSRAWGHEGSGSQLDEAKASIASMLVEYDASADVTEVRRLLHELAVPFFHHELVKKALVGGFEGPVRMDAALDLLRQLSATGDISVSQMTKGFQRVADSLVDAKLDNPGAEELFQRAVDEAKKSSWVEEGWIPVPTPGTPGAASNAKWANGVGRFHPSVQAYKKASLDIIAEYFDSGDCEEVARHLRELDEPGFVNICIKHAVQLSMDRRDREREMVSALLPVLFLADVAPSDQVSLGFTRLLAAADDLALDIPDAAHLLTLFLGRAIVDEVLPPKFLVEVVPFLPHGGLGLGVVQAVGTMLSARHSAERFATAWHAGTASGAAALSALMEDLVKEYVSSGDLAEADRCLRDLAVPHYHHELVYCAVLAALGQPEEGPAQNALGLVRALVESGEISQTQLRLGFDRLRADLEDLSLDFVCAPERIPAYEKQAQAEGWLLPAVQ